MTTRHLLCPTLLQEQAFRTPAFRAPDNTQIPTTPLFVPITKPLFPVAKHQQPARLLKSFAYCKP